MEKILNSDTQVASLLEHSVQLTCMVETIMAVHCVTSLWYQYFKVMLDKVLLNAHLKLLHTFKII